MTVGVRRAETDAEQADAIAVRKTVFVEEQGVPEDLELDGKDDEAVHFVAYAAGKSDEKPSDDADRRPVGVGRLREVGDRTGKVERIAVLKERRGE
jgi:predicted GNAT family N-acyltransferase